MNELVGFRYRLAWRPGALPAIALVALAPLFALFAPGRVLAQSDVSPREAVVGPTDAKIAAVCNEITTSKGPARYGAFRELWSLWEEADPQYIEAALDGFRTNPRLDAPSRAYASLLGAYARRRRGDIVGATSQVASLGYVHQWLVVGPFDNEGRAGLDRVFGPEQRMASPLDMQRAFDGKERQVRWRTLPDAAGFGWIDMGEVLRPSERVCAFAATFVRATDGQQSASKPRKATIWLGVTGAFRLFFNAEQVLSDGLYRTVDADRFATTVNLAPGWNQLVVKVCSDSQAPVLILRIADATGAPDKSLQVSADPALAAQAAGNAVQVSSQRPVVQASGTV